MSFNPFSLKSKSILVTGASSGIGRAVAISCSKMGADVIMLARDLKRLTETYNQLLPGKHSFFSINLTLYDSLEPIISQCVQEYGKFDGFVHAAGIEISVPLPVSYTHLRAHETVLDL